MGGRSLKELKASMRTLRTSRAIEKLCTIHRRSHRHESSLIPNRNALRAEHGAGEHEIPFAYMRVLSCVGESTSAVYGVELLASFAVVCGAR